VGGHDEVVQDAYIHEFQGLLQAARKEFVGRAGFARPGRMIVRNPGVGVSAASGAGLAELRREIAARLSLRAGSVGGRMRALARRALPLLQQQASAPPEAIASEVRRALTLLDEALLHDAPGDVLDLIFSSFCIGK
jgi:tRNA U34 5-carboxymethylaminomethyl modifying GTPase MnmE/TrmE